MAKLIEKVYGDALFDLSMEQGSTDSLSEEVGLVKQVLSENPGLAKLMQNPAIPEPEKEEVLKSVWEGRVSREIMGLMLLLLKNEHYRQLPLVLDYFQGRVREEKGIGVAYVRTAVLLTDSQKESVERKLLETTRYHSFEMHFEVDEMLIGGMVIRIGDRVLDSSIRTRLENMSRQLYQIKLQ